jgi:predicted ribosomally synthesized peptide with SipW-like signal peptide
MKKRYVVLLSVILIVAILAAGSFAYFSDRESLNGNSFTAGKLDLQLGQSPALPFNVGNVVPGQSGEGKVTLKNADGGIDGDLSISLVNLVGSENDMVEPELKAGDYMNGGDLHLFMRFAAFVDVNKNGIFDSGDIQLTYDGQQKPYPGFWGGDFHFAPISGMMNGAWSDVMKLTPGQSVDLVIMWQFPPESEDANYSQNIAMTDSMGFDAVFDLVQSY